MRLVFIAADVFLYDKVFIAADVFLYDIHCIIVICFSSSGEGAQETTF